MAISKKGMYKGGAGKMGDYTHRNALTGEYPDKRIDFTKVLLTVGSMPLAADPKLSINESGITFKWDNELQEKGTHWSDHVMLLAYFPELGKAVFFTAGAMRYQGTDHLPLIGIERGYQVETYFSFIADDHRTIANSIYTGQFYW